MRRRCRYSRAVVPKAGYTILLRAGADITARPVFSCAMPFRKARTRPSNSCDRASMRTSRQGDGVVTLTGHLDSFAEKHAVEHAVRRVAGVRGIAVELDVKLSPGHKRTDPKSPRPRSRTCAGMRWSRTS